MSLFTVRPNNRSKLAIALAFIILSQLPVSVTSARANFYALNESVVPANAVPHGVSESDVTVDVVPQPDLIRQIPLRANDMVYSTSTKMLYASVPSSSGVNGNSIASVDPVTGVVDSTVFVGSEPKKLALSDDGHTLYVSLEGAAAIRSFDVVSHALGLQFPLGSDNFFGTLRLTDMAVAPGNPNLVAVSRNYRGVSPPEAGVAVFENGVQRPVTTPGHTVASDFLSFSASAGTLYGCGFYSGLNTMTVNSAGVSITSSSSFSLGNAIRFDNGRVYGSTGQIVNPTGGTLVGTFSGVGSGPFLYD